MGFSIQIDPNRTLLEQCNDLPYDPDFEFPEDKLILGQVLGSGAFGKVIKAEAIGIDDFSPRDKSQKKSQRRPKMFRRYRAGHAYHDPRGSAYTKTTVAVKTVKEGATKEEVRDLASELKILIYVGEHKNIVNLLGTCIKRDRILVILEYAPHGSLLEFLRGKRDVYEATWPTTASDPEMRLNISNLVGYAYQISRGMEYLASKKCVHRDLAARNVLVGKDYVMKIADFGLARDIYKSSLYVKTNSGVLPMKWMAIESLFLREYSEKSDVWSFGICLWEIFTLGGTPYPTIPVEELLDFLNDGNRMENPRDCPSEIYKIMQDCWQEGPDKRPKFDQISQSIGTILEQRASQSVATEYLHLTEDNNRGRKDYYLDPHDSDPTVPVTRADVYDRRSSENIANNPLPPLPGDMEDQFDRESEERRQMLKPEIYGGSSGSEGDVELEEFHGNEQAVALELRPIAHSTEKAGNSKKKTTIV
ncbi:fibroblast growth factor receptor 4-like [Porites lutea]|uniref:fibroblast growth factor receptor 4-like n=1 Tax=Porites lutea TaxID=51062 RepID=UPI003CC61297